MRTIHKFRLTQNSFNEIEMPVNAQILGVGLQKDDQEVVMWAIVDDDVAKQKRRFRMYSTGEPVPKFLTDQNYIGTYQIPNVFGNRPYVGHLFEDKS